MIDKDSVRNLVENQLKGTSGFLVNVDVKPGNIIVVEIDDDDSVSIEDCISLNKYLESQFDREVEDYELEVGSAGIGQPFKILRQYRKNIGNEVEVMQKTGKKVTGILKDASDDNFIITITKQVVPEGGKRKVSVEEDLTFVYNDIKYTKYIIRFK